MATHRRAGLAAVLFSVAWAVCGTAAGDPRTTVAAQSCVAGSAVSGSVLADNFLASMEELQTNVSGNGYGTSTSGTRGPSNIFILGQCLRDLSPVDCKVCFGEAVGPSDISLCVSGSDSISRLEGFDKAVHTAVASVTKEATLRNGYALGSAEVGGATAFVLAQCWESLNRSACEQCLGTAADSVLLTCVPAIEGRALYTGCYLRYSTRLFWNVNAPAGSGSSGDGYSKNRRKTNRIAGSLSILMIFLLLFAFWLGYKKFKSKRKSKESERIESFLQKNGTIHPKRYSYTQVKRMTKSFAEKLGQGGFGAVYRGDLSDGRQIAVKMLKVYKTDGEDFINEVASISKTSHVNVVTLLGFCLERSKRALIYDYMPNGSLEKYALKDNCKVETTLGWEKLFDIAVGIARGLEYLHRGCNTRIVHFDIKPHNILLDQDFCPKISDFGLAKLCLNKESIISIGGARGTIGYIAPEVYSKQFGAVSSKSDVYSYGMMVLEMVGARDKNINANSGSSSQYFPQWIYEHLDEYCVGASEIHGEVTEIVRKLIVVGLWCIQISATDRPTMTRVVEMLEGSASDLHLPPTRS
ncbi:hypothetical protein QYE76_000498 [Lolium multiflorum]|uniref:Uncharacterized protein n=1 Tax=Lolium multiflorum TaxID=4521 RepID=A0AAD8RJ99_LOLMU|nr:hypothetical protein QYE76_000498 [Lolium multiflorum]